MINNKNDIVIQLVEPDKLMIDLEEKDDEIKNFLLNIKGLENKNNEFTFSLKMHKEIINKVKKKIEFYYNFWKR